MRKYGLLVLLLCLLLVFLGACSPSRENALPASVTASPSSFVMFSPVPTFTPTPTATLTPTPTPTPTPTLTFPVLIGMSPALPVATISAENVEQLKMVAVWGPGRVQQARWSPDGRSIAGLAAIGVYLYDVSTHARRFLLSDAQPAYLAFSPDGRLLAVAESRAVKLFRVEDGNLIGELSDFTTTVSSVDFSPDGERVAIGLDNGEVQIRSVEDWSLLQKRQKAAAPLLVRFLPDGTRLLFAGDNYQQVWLWNLETDEIRPIAPGNTHGIADIALTKDGRFLVVVGHGFGDITVWQVDTEKRVFRLPVGTQWFTPAAITPDGKMLVFVKEKRIEAWNLENGRLVAELESPAGAVFFSLAFAPDGQTLVAGSNDGLYFWQVEGEKLSGPDQEIGLRTNFAIRCRSWRGPGQCLDTAVSSSGEELVAVASDSEVNIWRLPDGALVRTFKSGEWAALALSRDGRFLATTAGTRVILWNVETGEEHALLRGHQYFVSVLAFSPNGEQVISGGEDGLVRVWRVADGQFLFDMEKPKQGRVSSLAISPNGQFVAGGTANGVIYIWQASNGVLLSVIRENKGEVSRLSFSPDSHWLLVSFDKAVEVWRVRLGKVDLAQTWPASTAALFSPSGELVATLSQEPGSERWHVQIRRSSDGAVLRTLPGTRFPLAFSSRGEILMTYISYGWFGPPFLAFWQVVP